MATVVILTKGWVTRIIAEGVKENFNRQLTDKFIDAIDGGEQLPVAFAMLHEHKAFRPVEPHVRIMFDFMTTTGEGLVTLFADLRMGTFAELPRIRLKGCETQIDPAVTAYLTQLASAHRQPRFRQSA